MKSTDLQVLLALWQRPGAAPLKNEKAGLFCCSQISPLLKNPIKRQKKVTFPFTAMTHEERSLSGQRRGAADEAGEEGGGFDLRGKELLID